MSATLLKRSLELLEASCTPSSTSGKSKNPFIPEQRPQKATISSIIKSKKKRKPNANNVAHPSQSGKNSIRTAPGQRKEQSSRTEENLKKLLMFNSPMNLDDETTKKLIRRAQTRKYVIPEPKVKEEESTVFTDEDFKKFEQEYFCS